MHSEPMEPIGSHDGFAYWGEHQGWLIARAQHRDSDALDRSNFRVFVERMEDVDPTGKHYAIERASHWAVGWIEYLLVEPDSACEVEANENRAALAEYPVLDDEDWSNEEYAEALEAVTAGINEWKWRNGSDLDAARLADFVVAHHPMMGVEGPVWFIDHGFDCYRYSHDDRHRPEHQDDRDTLAAAIRKYHNAD